MAPSIPFKSLALFRSVKRVGRDDTLLVDHPERGLVVRRVSAVSMNGRVGLRGVRRSATGSSRLSNVDPERVIGKLVLTMRWMRFLPYFGPPAPAPAPSASEAMADGEPDAPAQDLATPPVSEPKSEDA